MKTKENTDILSYGYEELDEITGGFHPGELILVGARPAMGSSCFMHNVLARLCNNDFVPAIYVSEQKHVDYMFNLLEIYSELPDAEKSNANPFETALVICDFTYDVSKIKRHLQENTFSILIIDSVRLVAYSETDETGTPNDFGDFFEQLKELAVELSIPVVVIAKWPRICEMRYESNNDPRPLLDDFSVTTVSEKSFDTILFLYRDDYYYYDGGNLSVQNWRTNIMECIVAKSFCNNTGVCKLHYNDETGIISESMEEL